MNIIIIEWAGAGGRLEPPKPCSTGFDPEV